VLPTANAGSAVSTLLAVSCASPTSCTAVGYYRNRRGGDRALAEDWNGATWSLSAVANPPARDNQLDAVSCPSARSCLAVGSTQRGSATRGVLAESWNGRRWSVLDAPDPSHHAWLAGVSCASAGSCIAVGAYQSVPDRTRTLAESWNGTTWSVTRSANPRRPTKGDVLSAVSCASPTACTAVGTDVTRPAWSQPLAESWNGTDWTVDPTPHIGGPKYEDLLASVACTSATTCLAVGYHGLGNQIRNLAESWQSGQWLRISAPGLPTFPSLSDFNAVSCLSARACMAVGFSTNNASRSRTLAARWNGTRWLRTLTPELGRVPELNGVSCPSATFCVAVGQGLAGLAVAESWNGSTWSVMRTPAVAGGLSAVSCASATFCVAVGDHSKDHLAYRALAESWDGRTWSVLRSIQDPPGDISDLYAVSCASADACTAVGTTLLKLGGNVTLAESWNGTTWSLRPTPAMTSQYYVLDGVSCVSADACLAVGTRRNVDGTDHSLAESWNGTQWSVVRTRHIGPFDGFGAVSCFSASRCTAVSSYATKTAQVPLAESWNGKAWTQITTQPSDFGWFNGVSCWSARHCVAVGIAGGQTLVESG
jgi:hypothetical protein